MIRGMISKEARADAVTLGIQVRNDNSYTKMIAVTSKKSLDLRL